MAQVAEVCRPYACASVAVNGDRERDLALMEILRLPQRCLVRKRGGRRQRGVRGLATQLSSFSSSSQPHQVRPAPHVVDFTTAKVQRAVYLVQQGYLARATLSMFQHPLLPLTPKTLDALDALHPKASDPAPDLPQNAPQRMELDPDNLVRVIRRLANGSAPAGSGWTGELIRALVDDHDCFKGLNYLITDILNGVFEGQTRNALLTGVLVAARKSSESDVPRPIVMGEAFYKLAGLYALQQVRSDLAALVAPVQMAFARGGAESALQLVQAALDAKDDNIVVTVDIENAYNTRKRSQILAELFHTSSFVDYGD